MISEKFRKEVSAENVESAFRLWCQELERILIEVSSRQGFDTSRTGAAKRGQIVFHEQRLFPKTVRQQACTLKTRKLWKTHCRLHEIIISKPGYRRDKTIDNLQDVLSFLDPTKISDFSQAISAKNFQKALHIVDAALELEQLHDKQKRVQEWKRSMRKDETSSYQYIRRKSTAQPVRVSLVDNQLTAEHSARLTSIAKVWKEIYSKHQAGEPNFRTFMASYGEHLKSHTVSLPPITCSDIQAMLNNTKPSSPGLDQITISEIQAVCAWCPIMLSHLVSLYQLIENRQKWPQNLVKGAVALIPKDSDKKDPLPSDYRPITILSTVYRLWSAIRHQQLASVWSPHWKHPQSYGGKFSQAADQLAFDTCRQIEEAFANNHAVAGISYDLAKCFDSVPYNLALDIFSARGADLKVVKTLRAFYSDHRKHFRLEGSYLPSLQPCNGIVQGCPLSMLILSSVVTAWLEHVQARTINSTQRAYADDMSSLTIHSNKQHVQTEFRKVHQLTQKFIQTTGLSINEKKTFTFGSKSIKNSIPSIAEHCDSFRLVGCSIKLSNARSWTPLENNRKSQWQSVVQLVQTIPRSWNDKTAIIQSLMPKLTFGQGMHHLNLSKDNARNMRASVVRTLLNTYNYNASPHAIFALLTKPSIDPEFALQLSAFNLIRRMYKDVSAINQLKAKIQTCQNQIDGPVARAKQLLEHPVFGETMKAFLSHNLHPHKFQHQLREAHRKHMWTLLCRDRPQHFAGCHAGVDRDKTLAYLSSLTRDADHLQAQCDLGTVTNPPPHEDPRAKAKVLRLLLSAGLQNPERQHRHKKQAGTVQCTCKQGEPSLEHISWFCPNFKDIRDPILPLLPSPIDQLPTCFRCCGIVPFGFNISIESVCEIQRVLVQIWQAHIDEWYNGAEKFHITPESDNPAHESPAEQQPNPAGSSADKPVPVPQNGHVLKLLDEGGVFCMKCGKSTKLLKHQRLKILSKPCQKADLPQHLWVNQPGAHSNPNRLHQAWQELLEVYNTPGHDFVWNEKCGKDPTKTSDYGQLWCQKCGRQFAWKHRICNLPNSKKCVPTSIIPSPPDWVVLFRNNPHQSIVQQLSVAEPSASSSANPRRRLTGKQKSDIARASTQTATVPAANLPRSGIG